jgi:CubicO group peptidase (beta-lactamase class C family)
MPAGGLFSTAADTARFCQMMLRRGEFGGKRLLSEAAWTELTKRQTPESMKDSYGLGFFIGRDSFGHGGAHATNMDIRPTQGIALIWMVQHTGGFPGKGAEAQNTFKTWASARFAKP